MIKIGGKHLVMFYIICNILNSDETSVSKPVNWNYRNKFTYSTKRFYFSYNNYISLFTNLKILDYKCNDLFLFEIFLVITHENIIYVF